MKNFNLNYFFIISIFLLSCNDSNECLRGGGFTEEIDLEQSNFEDIEVAGAINIELTQGPTFETILVIEPELFPNMDFGVVSNTFFLGTKNGECINPTVTMTLKITAPTFNGILIAGASNLTTTAPININSLELSVAGSVNSTIEGSANSQIIRIDGAADVNHFGLNCNIVNIAVNGSGDFDIVAEDALTLTINGGAIVKYRGNPQIIQDVSGSLSLIDSN